MKDDEKLHTGEKMQTWMNNLKEIKNSLFGLEQKDVARLGYWGVAAVCNEANRVLNNKETYINVNLAKVLAIAKEFSPTDNQDDKLDKFVKIKAVMSKLNKNLIEFTNDYQGYSAQHENTDYPIERSIVVMMDQLKISTSSIIRGHNPTVIFEVSAQQEKAELIQNTFTRIQAFLMIARTINELVLCIRKTII